MAKTDTIAASARSGIASQLAAFPGLAKPATASAAAVGKGTRGARSTRAAAPRLGEEYALCGVTSQQVESPPADLTTLLTPSGFWFHTLRTGKVTTHFSVSQAGFDAKEHNVLGYFESPLGAKIDAASLWIDEHDQDDDAVVRMLTFPAYYTYAFGMLRGGQAFAVLIDQPADFKQLKYEKEYPLKAFLAGLAKEKHL